MFGAVAADGQIHGIAIGIVVVPNFFAGFVPPMRDGIADHEQINVSFFNSFVESIVALQPSGFMPTWLRSGGNDPVADGHTPSRYADVVISNGSRDVFQLGARR